MFKCSCGGNYMSIEGLEGYTCDSCGAFMNSDPTRDYSEDKLKSIRGIPVNRFIIGSESKGRIEISLPIFLSVDEQKKIIEQQLDLLKFTKEKIKNDDIDIMPNRKC